MSTANTRTRKIKAASTTTLPSQTVARAPVAKKRAKNIDAAPQPGPALNLEERTRLVAQAAYFRAEKRGFAPGYELQDWAEAEAEVLRLIGSV